MGGHKRRNLPVPHVSRVCGYGAKPTFSIMWPCSELLFLIYFFCQGMSTPPRLAQLLTIMNTSALALHIRPWKCRTCATSARIRRGMNTVTPKNRRVYCPAHGLFLERPGDKDEALQKNCQIKTSKTVASFVSHIAAPSPRSRRCGGPQQRRRQPGPRGFPARRGKGSGHSRRHSQDNADLSR